MSLICFFFYKVGKGKVYISYHMKNNAQKYNFDEFLKI